MFRLLRELVKARQEMNQLLHQSVSEEQLLLENAQLTTIQRSEGGKALRILFTVISMILHRTAVAESLDPKLKVWLEGCGVDKATMNKVLTVTTNPPYQILQHH